MSSASQSVFVIVIVRCGKTTQIPQFILDDSLQHDDAKNLCNVVCTQPRRISAMSIADRVASERNEKVGGSVGYQIRLENAIVSQYFPVLFVDEITHVGVCVEQSSRTRLQFCTTGILLKRLESDASLEDVTHVVVDEVHERTEEGCATILTLYISSTVTCCNVIQ